MGYSYNSATPKEGVDYMYQVPSNLIMKVIENADTNIDNTIQKTDLLGNAVANIKHLPQDEQTVKQIQNEYNSKIQDITSSITKNPQDYRQYAPKIRDITRSLMSDMNSGRLAAIEGNASSYVDALKRNQERVNSGKISPERFNRWKNYYNSQYQGVNYDNTTGNYNKFNSEDLPEDINVSDIFDKYISDTKASSQKISGSGVNSMWRYTDEQGTKEVSYPELIAIAQSKALTDTKLHNEIKTGTQLGYYSKPELLGQRNDGTDIQGYRNLLNNGNGLSPIPYELQRSLAASATKYAYSETEKSHKIDGDNPYTMKSIDLSNQKAMADYNHAIKKTDENESRQQEVEDQNRKTKLQVYEQYAKNPTAETKELKDKLENGDVYGLLNHAYEPIKMGDVSQTGVKSMTTDDIANNLHALDAQLKIAQNTGDKTTENLTKAAIYNLSSVNTNAQKNGYNTLKSQGFTDEQINNFHQYMYNEKYKNNIDNAAGDLLQSLDESEKDNPKYQKQVKDLENTSKLYQQMSKVFNTSTQKWIDDNKNNIVNTHQGINLSGDLAGVRTQVNNYIQNNPDKVEIYDNKNGQPSPEITTQLRKIIKDGKPLSTLTGDNIEVVSDNGIGLKVKVNNKDYTLRFKGNTNIDNLVTNALSDHKDQPEIKSFINSINDRYRKSVLYDVEPMSNGESKQLQLYRVDKDSKSGQQIPVNIQVDADKDGYFTASYITSDGNKLPITSERTTKEKLASDISTFLRK